MTTPTAGPSTVPPAPSPSSPPQCGRDQFIRILHDEGVRHLFGNPGTTELPIIHALSTQPNMRYVLGLHESVVVSMADGFSRGSGQLAVCNVHAAPGLGNAMGAIYTAHIFGSPMIITAGQHEISFGLTEPLLYSPLVPIAQPLVKWAVEVTRVEDLPMIMHRAAKIATTAPTGPVFVSLPGDVLNAVSSAGLGRRTRVDTQLRPSVSAVNAMVDRILAAKKVLILAGQELVAADALYEATQFAETIGAPVYSQTIQNGAHYPSDHVAYMGYLVPNQAVIHRILQQYDLLICLGADLFKLATPSAVDPLPSTLSVMMVGERDWEMGKTYGVDVAIRANVKEAINSLIPQLKKQGGDELSARAAHSLSALQSVNWAAQKAKRVSTLKAPVAGLPLPAEWLMMKLATLIKRDHIVVDEGISTTLFLLKYLPFTDRHSYFSAGTHAIGWAMPAAVGIQMAHAGRRVIALIGDGSAMFSIQALWTAANLALPMTFIIFNNFGYEVLKYRIKSFHGNERPIGMDLDKPHINIGQLSESMGVPAVRVENEEQLDKAFNSACSNNDGPTLIEIIVNSTIDY